uniref:choline-phosphate cytidylyltransferase n=1 Tax=viral metagenome TaxID=1070528 RepID=A0A6C0J6D8_9ZZZZ
MRIYIDGIFDLFHFGHLESFRKCKELSNDVHLIVGIIGDKVAQNYKRLPIINEEHRYSIVEHIDYVDEIIKDSPLIITKEFMEKYDIDYVVHAFSNKNDANNQIEFFKYPKGVNKFIEIEYSKNYTTSKIINKIKQDNV